MRAVAAVLLLAIAPALRGGGVARAIAQQDAVLRVTVRDSVAGVPLQNAEVIDERSGIHRFTDERGRAFIPWDAAGRLELRVRQVGYRPVRRTLAIERGGVAPESILVALRHIDWVLPSVTTSARRHCAGEQDPVARGQALAVLEQLQLAADRYAAFRTAYPFRVIAERRTARLDRYGQRLGLGIGDEEQESEEWGDIYYPGGVLHDGGRPGFSVSLLFVSALADSAFWGHHCFSARAVAPAGSDSTAPRSLMRLDFSPDSTLRTPDWAGSALLDAATGELRRVEFQLVSLPKRGMPHRFEGYTTFRTPSPFVVIPDSTVAMWWRRGPDEDAGWGSPDIVQLIRVKELRYRKERPPAAVKP